MPSSGPGVMGAGGSGPAGSSGGERPSTAMLGLAGHQLQGQEQLQRQGNGSEGCTEPGPACALGSLPAPTAPPALPTCSPSSAGNSSEDNHGGGTRESFPESPPQGFVWQP